MLTPREQHIRELFGRFSASYDEHMHSTNHVQVQTTLLHALHPYIGEHILDIACGTGLLGEIVSEMKPCQYTGIDFQPDMLQIAKKRLTGNAQHSLHEIDAHQLAALPGTYDTILCCFGFYWFQSPHIVAQQMSRKLTKHGHILVCEERFFDDQSTRPAFAERGHDHAELAALEHYTGVEFFDQLFTPHDIHCTHELALPIDQRHELVGKVFHHA